MAYTIGIAGGSASGKSTLAATLEKRFSDVKVGVLHMDSYFKKAAERPISKGPVNGKPYMDDNHPMSMDIPGFRRDLAAMQASDYDVIITEGLLVLWDDEVYSMLDMKLFLDCRADERIVRRLRRNMGWGLSFDEVANVYVDLVRYRHDEYVEPSKWRADLILNGTLQSEVALSMIASAAYEHMGK